MNPLMNVMGLIDGQEIIISENIQHLDAEEELEESNESEEEEAEQRVDSDITDITKFPFMVSPTCIWQEFFYCFTYTAWIKGKMTAASDYLRRLKKSGNIRTEPARFLIAFVATLIIANIN